MSRPPRKDIQGTGGKELSGRRIILGITGSVAAIKAPEIARDLMRLGGEVHAVMTQAAARVIHPDIMEWATGNEVVTELTGKAEHIELAGDWPGHADLLLIAPATANTVSKIAAGIDDTPVTTVASVALGSGIPILVAPGMHEPMYANPFVQQGRKRLEQAGVRFIEPQIVEGKAKLASTEDIVQAVIARLGQRDLAGRRVLITAGPTRERLDPVRVLTNRSSGRQGFDLVREAVARGADVTLVCGPTELPRPVVPQIREVETTEEMRDAVLQELRATKYDVIIAAAAPADYRPERAATEKISTRVHPRLEIKLEVTPKILEGVRAAAPGALVVAFKADASGQRDRMVEEARTLLGEAKVDVVVANDVSRSDVGFATEVNEVDLVVRDGSVLHVPLASKRQIARSVLDAVVRLLPAR